MREVIRCLIIGEKSTVERLLDMLTLHFSYVAEVVSTAFSLEEGVNRIHATNPGLVLVDPDVSDTHGRSLYDYFSLPRFSVVFITGRAEHALTAIKKGVLDILLMPVTPAKISESFELYLKRQNHNYLSGNIVPDVPAHPHANAPENARISLPTTNGYCLYKAGEIVYCKSRPELYLCLYSQQYRNF